MKDCLEQSPSPASVGKLQLKKRRGRPTLGKPTPVVMNVHEEEVARQMGNGVKSFGVRMALRAVQAIGIDKARELAKSYKTLLGDSNE